MKTKSPTLSRSNRAKLYSTLSPFVKSHGKTTDPDNYLINVGGLSININNSGAMTFYSRGDAITSINKFGKLVGDQKCLK